MGNSILFSLELIVSSPHSALCDQLLETTPTLIFLNLTLTYRLSHAIECLNIFSEHPEWDRGTRRLNLRGIEDGNGDILAKADHITPQSWEGDVNLRNVSVNVITSWNHGRQMVESEFPSVGIAEALLQLEKKGHDLTFPFGQRPEDDTQDSDDDEEQEHLPVSPEPLSVPHSSSVVVDPTSKELLTVGDPAATIIQCEGHFFLAIVQINEICFDSSPILEINPRFLMEPAVTVQFQIYQVIEVSGGDPDIDGADWKWNRRLEKGVIKTKGSFIQVISPAVAIPEVNLPLYFFRTDELRATAASLFSSIPLQDQSRLPSLRKRTNHFPYRTKSALLVYLKPGSVFTAFTTSQGMPPLSVRLSSMSAKLLALGVLGLITATNAGQPFPGTRAKHPRSSSTLLPTSCSTTLLTPPRSSVACACDHLLYAYSIYERERE